MEKISVLTLVLLTNFLFCHPYVTMPIKCELKFGIKYDLLPA